MATLSVKQLVKALTEAFDPRFERIDQRFEKIDQRFERIDQRFERIDQRFERIDRELEDVKKRVYLLPTRQEFFDKMDENVTELQITRDEQIVLKGQIEDHEDRLSTVEARLKIPQK